MLTSLTNEFKLLPSPSTIKVIASYPVVHSRLTFEEGSKEQQQQQQQQNSTLQSTTTTTAAAATMFHPRFLSRADFEGLSTATTTAAAGAAPILDRPQIIKWRSLEIGAVFRVIDRITIPTALELKHYVVLQTEQQQIIHVWLTDIMNKEL